MRAPSLASTLACTLTRASLCALVGLSLSACDGADAEATPPSPDAPAEATSPATAPTARGDGMVAASGPAAAPTPGTPDTPDTPDTDSPDAPPAGDGLEGITGLNFEGLTKARRISAGKLFQTEASACGQPHSLATSLREDAACRDSSIIAQYIVDELRKGLPESTVSAAVVDRLKELKVREISIEGRPVFGNARAPVTIVVFADFECPHCAVEAPKLQAAVRDSKGKAKLVFRHFPLNGHDRGRKIALATEAALAQSNEGFWAIHNAGFAGQAELVTQPDKLDGKISEMAKAAGLDMARFEDHLKFKRGDEILDADKAAGEALDIQGTPAVYINGREYSPFLFGGDLNAWIADAANRPTG